MIALRNVRKSFGTNLVLDGISLEVSQGEVVCVIGVSGSGKSTLLRCVNGLESYDSGEVVVDGRRVDRDKHHIVAIREKVAMVFQRFNLFPHRTALENVIEGPVYVKREPRAQAIERARALLVRVGLAGKEDDYPHRLSGGQQQRVAIRFSSRPTMMISGTHIARYISATSVNTSVFLKVDEAISLPWNDSSATVIIEACDVSFSSITQVLP